MTTESSAAKTEDKQATPQKTVPVAAVGEAREKAREAKERAATAEAALASEKSTQVDYDELTAAVLAEARKQVEAEVAPLKARAARAEMALQLGLNTEQVEKVMEIKSSNPTLNDQQALLLAKSEHADLFPSKRGGFDPALHGRLPTNGLSDLRQAPGKPDYRAKIEEAKKAGDRAAVQHWAQEDVLQRFREQFNKARGISSA